MMRLGLIVNPIAGMGGPAGMKGTDSPEAVARARQMGIEPNSPLRAIDALSVIAATHGQVELLAPPGDLGVDEARAAGLRVEVIGEPTAKPSTGRDTILAARALRDRGVDLLLFAGGDGTARDVCEAIGTTLPVIGVPTGVKMHSAVHARGPRAAGKLAVAFITGGDMSCRELEVMDVDEEAARQGRVSARLYGYLWVPFDRTMVQGLKVGSQPGERAELAGIAREVIARVRGDELLILGPGTTTRAIAEALGLPKTLLGVDVVLNGRLIARDVAEPDLLRLLDGQSATIVVTPIGGQGFILGRGNQQLSPRVIRQVGADRIHVVATSSKLAGLRAAPLLVDTGDPELDRELIGYRRVITGTRAEAVCRVEA